MQDEARDHVAREMYRESRHAMGDTVLSTAQGERVFMQAANQVRDILAVDCMREASVSNPHFLTAAGNFHHENGFAPEFDVARSFMRDLRFSSEHPSAAPGYEFVSAPVPATALTQSKHTHIAAFDTNASRRSWQENLDTANRLRSTAAAERQKTKSVQGTEANAGPTDEQLLMPNTHTPSGVPATAAAPGVETPTQASVMAKLQHMQQQLMQAGWQPGQPLPASLGDPRSMFAGEMHLLPPPLAAMLQGLLAQGGNQQPAESQAPGAAIKVEDEPAVDAEDEDAWED